MPELRIRTTDARDAAIAAGDVESFAASLRGEVIPPGAPQYDGARQIWNGMIDRRPAAIVRCRSSADVVRAVRFARRHDALVAVRAGGHNIAGLAVADGALVIDLTPMRGVRIDPAVQTAHVEPGVTLGELDRDAQTFGLATPLGINSTTGVAGLTLGGGYGWLSRKYGLTVDNLRSVDVVTADGALVTANDHQHPDLFWAVRGGGGNFGVATSYEYTLHSHGPETIAGLIVHPFDDAAALLRRYRDIVADAPDELSVWVVMRKAPPLPFLPESVHGREVIVFAVHHAGTAADAERDLRRLRAIGTPHADVVGPMPYAAFQAAFDPLLAPGARNYWKSHNFSALHDEVIDILVGHVGGLPGPMCEIFLAQLGGAVSRKPDYATAYAGREAQFVMNVHGRWTDAADDERCIEWARRVYADTASYAGVGAYINFMTAEETDRVRDAYGGNYPRLAAIKAKYDPTNFFRCNQNIAPLPGPVDAGPAIAAPTGTTSSIGATPGTVRP